MKKILFLFPAMLIALLGVFTSCTDDGTTSELNVSLEAAADTAEWGENIVLNISISADAELETMMLELLNPAKVIIDSTFDKDKHTVNMSAVYSVPAQFSIQDAYLTFELTVTDKDGQSVTEDVAVYVVKPVVAGDPISSFTAVLMGAQDNATKGSFLDASEGDVYLQAAANTNSGLIDIIYYYGSTNEATLTAPDDATVNGGGTNLSLATGFSTQNGTRFNSNPGVTAGEFDAMTDDIEIAALSSFPDSKITQLAVGDVISFEAVGGKKGLIKVASISTGATGTITIDVKIQK